MYAEGVYKVRTTSWEFLITSKKECPQFQMNFAVVGAVQGDDIDAEPEPCEAGTRSWSISIPEGSAEQNVEWLLSTTQHLGYDGDDLLGLDPDEPGSFNFEGVEFFASCKHEEHDGRVREKWSVYRPRKTMAKDRLRDLNTKFGHKAKQLKERRATKETNSSAKEPKSRRPTNTTPAPTAPDDRKTS